MRKFAILRPDSGYGGAVARAFAAEVAALGDELVTEVTYKPDTKSFAGIVKQLGGGWQAVFVPEAADKVELVARLKKKDIHDLVVFVLDRPRHAELVDEIRRAGARVMLRAAGDVAGALLVVAPNGRADMLMGVGGVSEGIMAACAVRALGGGMLGRLAPQSDVEREEIKIAGLNTRQILSAREIIASDNIFFAATGITDGPLLSGVRYHGKRAETHSLILRGETGTRRLIYAEHVLR